MLEPQLLQEAQLGCFGRIHPFLMIGVVRLDGLATEIYPRSRVYVAFIE